MTEAPPCSSKHGAIRYTTGPEPAGGRDGVPSMWRGGGTSVPQMRVDVLTGGAGSTGVCAGGCCARTGAAHSTTNQISVFTRVNMKELPTGERLNHVV